MKNLYLILSLLILSPCMLLAQNENEWRGDYSGNGNIGSVWRTTFFGFRAGDVNYGNDNTFIGARSGKANGPGSRNSFLGTYSGYQNSSGYDNIFIGYKSAYKNTTGKRNVVIGAYAAMGAPSPIAYTNGEYNTIMGYRSAYNGISGNYNTLIGGHSGYNTNSGMYNTFLGSHSGYNSNGSRNVFLGYQAGYNESGSNKLYIDNSSTATPLIYGDFSLNHVGINVKPLSSYTFQVGGDAKVNNDLVVDDKIIASRGGIAGRYNSNNVQGIWSIGDFYQIDESANDFGNQYGLVYAHTNSGQGVSGWGHQVMLVANGSMNTSLSLNGNAYFSRNVGVGTADPKKRLHVSGGTARIESSHGYVDIGPENSNWAHITTDMPKFYFNKNVTVNGDLSSYNSDLNIQTAGSTRMTLLNSNGNVGIGETNPVHKLQVDGRTYTNISLIFGNQEQSYVSGTAGELYFDQNYYPDYAAITGGNGGGLSILTEDGWGALIATNNMEWITPTFDGGVFKSEVAFNGGIKGNSDGGSLKIQTDHGWTEIGAQNTSWSHFGTDRPRFYFEKAITVDEGQIGSYDEDLELQTAGTTQMTISHADGDVNIHNNLIVDGGIQFDPSSLIEDNSEDDLMVIRGDGSMGTRSVKSIESPWMFEEYFNGQDTLVSVSPDSAMIGNVFIDVIDLNGNIRMGDNAYLDDDTDFGDEGTPDDWMRFNDHIEFRSGGVKKGIVLYDANTFLDYTNIHHEAGTTYMANGQDADSYFLSATGRDVTFGGNVTLPTISGGDQFTLNSPNTLYLSMDGDNDSETAGETNAISFGRNGEGSGANYDELMRIEEDGGIFINNLSASTEMVNMVMIDENNKIHYRDVNTLKLSPWDDMGNDISFTSGDVAIGGTTIPAGYKLAVDGKVLAEELKVELSEAWPDYVFESDYELMPIEELKEFVKEEKHLPNVPSQATVEKEGGIDVGEMNQKLLEKVEELTLYMIQQNDRMAEIEAELAALKVENKKLRKESN